MNELEFVLNKILDIDIKASNVKSSTAEKLKNDEVALNESIKNLEKDLIEKDRIELGKKYEKAMDEARLQSAQIIEESEKQLSEIREKYLSVKDELRQKIVDQIILS